MAYAVSTHATTATLVARLAHVLAQVADRMERRRVYKQTVAELSGLSGRELADLGIGRSQIRAIALEAAGLK